LSATRSPANSSRKPFAPPANIGGTSC
jgi:hypothetical protein